MVFRKVILERIPSVDEVLSISKSGIGFGAVFMKSNELQNKTSVSFYTDDEDPYKLGFEFYDESGKDNSLMLTSGNGTKGAGRNVKASELLNKNRILKSIQNDPVKSNRLFPIKKDKGSSIYYILLRPAFEIKVSFDKRNSIDEDISGVYRYLDKSKKVIYIGKGNIKNRVNSQERKEWGIETIEYSVLDLAEDMFKWESFYLDSYLNENGMLPTFNRISGHDSRE